MKKNIMLLAAGALLLMGGCSKSEIDEGSINSTSAISFSASSNRVTKAPAVTNENAKNYDFGVFAYYTKDVDWTTYSANAGKIPNFMNNEEVSYDSSNGWTYDPVKYWPNTSGEMISFFGYMPYSDATSASIGTGGVPTIVFTQTMDAEKMEDLVVAKALDQTKTTSAVVLPFDHVLSRLNFAAKVDHDISADPTTKVFVKKLRILGTAQNEDVETSTDKVDANSASKFYNTASYIMSADTDDNGAWDYTEANLTKQDAALDATEILAKTAQSFGAKSPAYSTESVAINQAGSSTSLLTSGEYLFLIPPSENGVESATDVVIQVDYDIVTADAAVDAGYTLSSTTATLSMPNGTLKEGVAYNVVMTIGLTEVTLSAEPTVWIEPTTDTEAIPTEVTVYSETGITDAIADAFTANVAEYTVNYEGNDEALSLDLSSASNNLGMDLIINIPSTETKTVEITIPENYSGSITIYAPNSTVTANTTSGTEYTNVTVTTAQSTFIIPAGVTVENLTILGGNVEVYGVLKGTIVKGSTNTESTTITVMSGGVCVAGEDTTIGEGITLNAVPTAEGVYYSLDNGVWTSYNTTTLQGETSHTKIAFLTVGSSATMTRDALYAAYYNENLLEVDLSQATWHDEIFGNNFVTSSSGLVADKVWKISIPKNVTSIYNGPFYRFKNTLTDVVFNEVIEKIGYQAFNECTALTEVILPKTVTTLDERAFKDCQNLRLINIGNITSFGDNVFLHCYNLAGDDVEDGNLDLNDNVTSLPGNFIAHCYKITSIDLHDGLLTLGNGAFQWSGLKSITIPQSITNIGTSVFNRSDITEITFADNSNISLVQNMFSFCKSLTTFDFTNVVSIGDQAFYNSTLAGDVVIPSTVDMSTTNNSICFASTEISTFEIEEGGQGFTLGDAYLYNCYNMTSVTFPSTLQGFSGRALGRSTLLSTIVCKATTVPTTTETDFGFIDTDGSNYYTGCSVTGSKILYVPNGCKDKYESLTMDDGTENYWKTILIDICGFEVVELDAD